MQFIYKLFIKDYENIQSLEVKSAYGKVSSIVGIVLNIFLFGIKFIVGTLFHSVSIQADAFNNLSDAGSSVVSLVSFVFSSRPADEEHPFGHERFEYICSLGVSVMIMVFAYELVISSFTQILHPKAMQFDFLMAIVLLVSIAVKLFMFYYNNKYGKLIDSSVMKATAVDSIGDVFASGCVFVGITLSYFINFSLDGYLGLIVAIMIAKSGLEIIKDTMNEILGEAPDPTFIASITSDLLAYDGVLGIHDLVVHSYGSNKMFVTVHVEVSASDNIMHSHDLMDNIEKEFKKKRNIDLVIHMDPIDVDDPYTNDLRERCQAMVKSIDTKLTMHDFRIVKGHTHNNLIFDVVVPIQFPYTDKELMDLLHEKLPQNENGPINYAVITLDRAYTTILFD